MNAYLQIEKARFQAHLQVTLTLPPELAHVRLPAFTLQPIVENAIKHGTSQMMETGKIQLTARQQDDRLVLEIEDNAGLYQSKPQSNGLGMSLVEKRLRARFGDQCAMTVSCEPDLYTRITLQLPMVESPC